LRDAPRVSGAFVRSADCKRGTLMRHPDWVDAPSSERFGLIDQMRRAAISVGSNVAEGAGRSGDREFLRFVNIAYASASD
jgi:hypothetical protein